MITKALWAGIILIVAGFLALAGINLYEWTMIAPALAQQRDLVVHTYDVISTARSLEAELSQAERGQRGFIITGNHNYLDAYRSGISATPKLLAALKQLTAENPEQQPRMPMLEAEVDRRLAILQQTLDLREKSGFEAARRLVESNLGLDTMRAVTAIIDSVVASESTLLQSRLAELAGEQGNIRTAAEAGAGLTLMVMAAGGLLIWFAWRERERDRKDLEETRTLLAQAQKMETLGQLAGGIAHDFNNMLAVIRGSTQMLRRRLNDKDPEIARIVGHIDQGTDRAAGLTARLLAFSRRRPVTPEMIDANAIIAGLADILRYTLGGGIEVQTALAPDLWPIFVDRNQLENAILNLAVNARDAMPDGGRLTIETRNISVDGKTAVEILVRDTGRGMAPEVLQRALEPFFTTKDEGRGTGLGLAQVQALVRQSDGSVQIDSAPGTGTTVSLCFPALS